MSIRKITINLNSRYLLACYNFLEKYGQNTKELPPDKIVWKFLAAQLENLMREVVIKDFQEAHAESIIKEKLLELSVHSTTQQAARAVSPIASDEDVERVLELILRSTLATKKAAEAVPRAQLAAQPSQGKTRMTFSQIKELAPKDMLVELASSEGFPLADKYKRAIELAYAEIPRAQWGTTQARELVDALINKL